MTNQNLFPKLLHKQFVQLGSRRHKLKNEMLAILPAIYKSRIYKKYASSIVEYAGKYGDISRSTVRKRLRLEDKLSTKPHLKAAIKEVGIHKVAMVASIATPETDALFADKVRNMSKSAVQTLSKELRSQSHSEASKCSAVPQTIKIELDEEMTFLFLKLKKEMGENHSNKEVMRKILNRAAMKSTTSQGSPKKQKTTTSKPVKSVTGDALTIEKRYIPVVKRRESDTEGQCSYPCCNKPVEVFHHTQRFYNNKNHDSIIPLCHDHHEFMHNGLIPNETNSQKTWKLAIHSTALQQKPKEADILYKKYRQKAILCKP